MGDMAEMMLDGTLCEGCGSFIDETGGEGFPRYCSPDCNPFYVEKKEIRKTKRDKKRR